MQVLVRVFFALAVVVLFPTTMLADDYTVLFRPFDATSYGWQDLRFLQAALAFQGYYQGLLDGSWGPISARALEAFSLRAMKDSYPTRADSALAIADVVAQLDNEGWQIKYLPEYDVSLALPEKALSNGAASDNFLNLEHTHSSLRYSFSVDSFESVVRLHTYTLSLAADASKTYEVRNSRLMIASSTSQFGRMLYTRSDIHGNIWSTVMISASQSDANLLGFVSSSITAGKASEIGFDHNGPLYQDVILLLKMLKDPSISGGPPSSSGQGPTPPAVAAQPARPGSSATGDSGSGVYVASGGFVLTNSHVVKDCQTITVDGANANLINTSTAFDLALLQVPASGDHAFAQFATEPAMLNSDVTVVGYPLTGILGGLNVTRGSVSSLKGPGGDPLEMQISAPVQQGNSGGPVVDAKGRVVGIVVAKLNAQAIAQNTGDIPQNVNFAIRGEIAKLYLSSNGLQPVLSNSSLEVPPEELAAQAAKYTGFIICLH